jgi:hypothetical protein
MAEKAELVITALQQRIGEIVTAYETQIALLRAEITQLIEKENAKEEYKTSLENKLMEGEDGNI